MAEIATTGREASRLIQIGIAGVAGLLVAAAVAMWAIYGTATFVEMITAGINACF